MIGTCSKRADRKKRTENRELRTEIGEAHAFYWVEGQNGGGKLGERKPEQWSVLETKGREGLCGGKADIIKYMQGV